MADSALLTKIEEWIVWDRNDVTRNQIEQLKYEENWEELRKLLKNRMEFGTAGLRARMGPGYSQMNDLTIIQTSQGLLKYAREKITNLDTMGIVVGYDARHNSSKWAAYVANVFLNAGVTVYLFRDNYPTPLLAYGVRHFSAALGVMITASHNPKEDNGYKVYWSNGCQIISPHDKGISVSINECLAPRLTSWNINSVLVHPKCIDPMPDLLETYCVLQQQALCFTPLKNPNSKCRLTYTAMHGVGYEAVKRISMVFGFPQLVPVIEQVSPDPEIPTVKYPNPEEGKSALNLAINRADSCNSRIIFANDPDADRLAVAEKQSTGAWKIFTGNELGALFGWWIWTNWRKRHPTADVSKVGMLSSTVSSKILETIAHREGFYFEETLTGFKWMGNRSEALATKGINIIFAFEEAIGFMCGDVVLDKDGVSALAVMSELTLDCYDQCITLQERLDKIYEEYGLHISNNGYYFCHDPSKIKAMFHRIRNWSVNPSPAGYPTALGRFRLSNVRDLTTGYDESTPDRRPLLPVSKSSQCVTLTFENGVTMTIRTSGTEPKIKYYSELRAKPGITTRREPLVKELQELVDKVVEELYEPEKNGFTPQPS